jgi:hypothetical protein
MLSGTRTIRRRNACGGDHGNDRRARRGQGQKPFHVDSPLSAVMACRVADYPGGSDGGG